MRTSWAVVALGLGLFSAGASARGETVVGDYLPVVRTTQNPLVAEPVATAAPPTPAVPLTLAAPPTPANGTPGISPPAPYGSQPYAAPRGHYAQPLSHAGTGCSSCSGGFGGSFKDPCFCGFPCVWGSVDYVQLWFKDGFLPPLVTSGPGPLRPTLDRADTTILRGGGLDITSHAGMQATIGFGFPSDHPADPCCVAGIEFSGFFVAQKGNDFRATSEGLPLLGRPFVDVAGGGAVQVVADVAGVNPALRGTVQVNTQDSMGGIEMNGVCLTWCDPGRGYRLDFLFGARILSITEDVVVNEDLTVPGTGERIFVNDTFTARNRFYGGQVGLRGERRFGDFFVQATGKLALGATAERVYITGFTLDQVPGFEQVRATGGVLTQPTNIGRHYHNEFCILPEVQLKLGYQVSSLLRLSAGYSFLYLTNVVRPGNSIDVGVNSARIPAFGPGVVLPVPQVGPDRPAFQFNQTSFWAQGVTAGIELRY